MNTEPAPGKANDSCRGKQVTAKALPSGKRALLTVSGLVMLAILASYFLPWHTVFTADAPHEMEARGTAALDCGQCHAAFSSTLGVTTHLNGPDSPCPRTDLHERNFLFGQGGRADLRLVLAQYQEKQSKSPYFHPEKEPAAFAPYPLEGYPEKPCVTQGETLDFFVSTEEPSYDIEFIQVGDPDLSLLKVEGLAGQVQEAGPGAHAEGCGWYASYRLSVPLDWSTGLYLARLTPPPGSSTAAHDIPFVVKESQPGTWSRILTLAPSNTVTAYNSWGGASLYPSDYGGAEPFVSFHRPHDPRSSGLLNIHWFYDFIRYLDREDRKLEYASEVDLHLDPDLLDHYDMLLLFGHHEYWSREMRRSVDAFVANGGRLVLFSGNTCYWQVRFEDDHTLRCHKYPQNDPLFESTDPEELATVTTQFAVPPVCDPEDRTTGSGWRNASWGTFLVEPPELQGFFGGVYPNFLWGEGYGYYRVYAPEHVAFKGLDLQHGDLYGIQPVDFSGTTVNLVASWGEVDGVNCEEHDGVLLSSPVTGAPRNLLVLANAPAREGFNAFTAHEEFGEVLNTGSYGFVGFAGDEVHPFTELETSINEMLDYYARPRRSVVINGGFERWEAGEPCGYEVEGNVQESGKAVSGLTVLKISASPPATIRQRISGLEGNRDYVLVIHGETGGTGAQVVFRNAATQSVICSVDLVPGEGRYHHARGFAADTYFEGLLEITHAGAGDLIVDNLEIIPEDRWESEALALQEANQGSAMPPEKSRDSFLGSNAVSHGPGKVLMQSLGMKTGSFGHAVGGSRYLVSGTARVTAGEGRIQLVDLDRDTVIEEIVVTNHGFQPFYFDACDRSPGTMVRFGLNCKASFPESVIVQKAELLPLRAAAPPAAMIVKNGGFEESLPGNELAYWHALGRGRGSSCRTGQMAGRACALLDGADSEARLVQPLPALVEPGRYLLTAWCRSATGAGSIQLVGDETQAVVTRVSLSRSDRWEAVQCEFDLAAEALTQGVKLVIEAPAGEVLWVDSLKLQTLEDSLVNDYVNNGGFEIIPFASESETDWKDCVPQWCVEPVGQAALDDTFAFSGRASLRLDSGKGWSTAYCSLWDPVPVNGAWRLRVKGYTSLGAVLRVTLKAAPLGNLNLVELGMAPNFFCGQWEDLNLSIPAETLQIFQPHETVMAWIFVEAIGGTAWIDNLSLEMDE